MEWSCDAVPGNSTGMYHRGNTNTQKDHPLMRKLLATAALAALVVPFCFHEPAHAESMPAHPNILQRPSMSTRSIAFGYAGDLWVVPRGGVKATRLTVGFCI